MKIYTKTGDNGTTSLFGGKRVPKHHIRIESYGTVDELNSWLGLIRDQEIEPHTREVLMRVQDRLFVIGSLLATAPGKEKSQGSNPHKRLPAINDNDILLLEEEIDTMETSLPALTHFILPGGHNFVSYCHIARTVCRRAERMATYLDSQEPVDVKILKYLNRLSDYLFVLARKLSRDAGAEENIWVARKEA